MKAALKSCPEMCLIQCVVTRYNDKVLEKVQPYQCLFLTSTAAQAVADILTQAYEKGVDVFSPADGRQIILKPEQQRGIDAKFFNAELGDRSPLKEETCRKLWQPWDTSLRFHPQADMMRAAVNCFGRDVVEYAFGEEPVRSLIGAPAGEAAPRPESTTAVKEPAKAKQPAPLEEADDFLKIDTELPPSALDEDATAEDESDDQPAVGSADLGLDGDKPADAAAMAAMFEDLLDEDGV